MDGESYVFAGGGTGGHLFPGIAVAWALRELRPSSRVVFFTTNRPLDGELLGKTPFDRVPQSVQPFTINPWRFPAFFLHWRASVAAARGWIRAHRPRAVLGLGGYAAGPPVHAARACGVRAAILNPDAIPGRANRYLASRVDRVALQWDVSRSYFSASAPCVVTGCPIRAEFRSPPPVPAAREKFGLAPHRPVLLVTGASQGARTINEAMQRVWPVFSAMRRDWQLLHLTGGAGTDEIAQFYSRAGADARVLSFTHEMCAALTASDVVVSRAGASTLAELTALGRPSILLPYPYHKDRHQHANGQVLVDAGAAVMMDDLLDPAANAPRLLAALDDLADDARRANMASAARTLGRPRAAVEIAEWLAAGTER